MSGELIAISRGQNEIELTFPNDPPVSYTNVDGKIVGPDEIVNGVYINPPGTFSRNDVVAALGIEDEQVNYFGRTSMDIFLEVCINLFIYYFFIFIFIII